MNIIHGTMYISKYEEILFVISPSKDKSQWRINTVQQDRFMNKKDFPLNGQDLRTQELEKVTGVSGALFCHRKLFLAAAQTKEAASITCQKGD
jgi:uncharacterized UPF0160 family protein